MVLSFTSWFQMGLFVDLDPEQMMMGMEGDLDDPDLEAELAAITGNKAAAGGRAKPKGKSECCDVYCCNQLIPMPMPGVSTTASPIPGCLRQTPIIR